MVQKIVKNIAFLKQKSVPVTEKDAPLMTDLQDTLAANRDRCVGMAANMIGVKKRMIIVAVGPFSMILCNPVLVDKKDPYETEEGCLSLSGSRKTTRYQEIEVEYEDSKFQKQRKTFKGEIAQIIQHEADHLDGIII